ncbi:hypothetical protein GCK72_022424 [Caenorhabditis remanei]|uniref:JmjC domain-containing protein n=1 Tax=Caenorhabditis remanei TaxID=31234 RepID=A0A6A5FTT5_CAERE|nr:hypothetical protein GCK72_022424 [Caenorhabditis remanei]KAF1745974.1 hypothetical protein GCK72_022424 [Caenorhabditis remanei]
MEQVRINSGSTPSDVTMDFDHQTSANVDTRANLMEIAEVKQINMMANGENKNNGDGMLAGENASENGKNVPSGNMCNDNERSPLYSANNASNSSEQLDMLDVDSSPLILAGSGEAVSGESVQEITEIETVTNGNEVEKQETRADMLHNGEDESQATKDQQSELASGEDSSSLHVTSEHDLVASSEPAATTTTAENGDDATDIAGPSTSMAPGADTAAVARKVKVTTKKAKKDKEEEELRAAHMFSEFSLRVRKTAAPAEPPKFSTKLETTKTSSASTKKGSSSKMHSGEPSTSSATAGTSTPAETPVVTSVSPTKRRDRRPNPIPRMRSSAKPKAAKTSGALARKITANTRKPDVPSSSSSTTVSFTPAEKNVSATKRRERRAAPNPSRHPAPIPPRNVAPPRANNTRRAPLQIPPLPQFNDKKAFIAAISKFRKQGNKEFMRTFVAGEHLFENKDVGVKYWNDGHNYEQKIGEFNCVHLFKTKDGLEFEYPEKLKLANVRSFIPGATKLKIIDSYSQQSADMEMNDLVAAFKTDRPNRTAAFNLLSFEARNTKLQNKIAVPKFVRNSSIVDKLTKQLEEKKKEVLDTMRNTKERREKLKDIGNKIWSMPQYQKFVLLSMQDSFTDIHIDFSATSVYYHVVEGRKIFYVARPTPENLKVYKKYETDVNVPKEWIGKKLFSEFQRVEIKKGETAMIPSGYLHFVYTPEDSLVIGGNFLMEKYLQWQFELTAIEEESLRLKRIDLNQLYLGFYNVMWAYAEELLAKIEAGNPSAETIRLSDTVKGLLNPERIPVDPREAKDWYSEEQKKTIAEKMERALAQPPQPNVPTVQATVPAQPAASNKRRAPTSSSRKPPAKRRH